MHKLYNSCFALGADLPEAMIYVEFMSAKGNLYTIGNNWRLRMEISYKYSCEGSINSCKWTKVGIKIKGRPTEAIGFSIPDSFVDKLCK